MRQSYAGSVDATKQYANAVWRKLKANNEWAIVPSLAAGNDLTPPPHLTTCPLTQEIRRIQCTVNFDSSSRICITN